jgi:hypothetical protein
MIQIMLADIRNREMQAIAQDHLDGGRSWQSTVLVAMSNGYRHLGVTFVHGRQHLEFLGWAWSLRRRSAFPH